MPPEYRICVTGGYPMVVYGAAYEAEAIVYLWGGRTVARFIAGGRLGQTAARRTVERRARAWITADDATRAKMQRLEHGRSDSRTRWWSEWWRRDAT